MQVFGTHISDPDAPIKVQVWPELREAHDAICNKGVAEAEIMSKFHILTSVAVMTYGTTNLIISKMPWHAQKSCVRSCESLLNPINISSSSLTEVWLPFSFKGRAFKHVVGRYSASFSSMALITFQKREAIDSRAKKKWKQDGMRSTSMYWNCKISGTFSLPWFHCNSMRWSWSIYTLGSDVSNLLACYHWHKSFCRPNFLLPLTLDPNQSLDTWNWSQ